MIALIDNLLTVFLILIFARIILSWFPPSGGVIDQIRELVGRARAGLAHTEETA